MGTKLKKLGRKFPVTLASLVVVLLTVLLSIGDPASLGQVGFYLTTTLISWLVDNWKIMDGGHKDGNDSMEHQTEPLRDTHEDQ
ncbi:MAG TPA: hypothetical protein V6D33_09000 [Cyanophyceae cyanobacterium]